MSMPAVQKNYNQTIDQFSALTPQTKQTLKSVHTANLADIDPAKSPAPIKPYLSGLTQAPLTEHLPRATSQSQVSDTTHRQYYHSAMHGSPVWRQEDWRSAQRLVAETTPPTEEELAAEFGTHSKTAAMVHHFFHEYITSVGKETNPMVYGLHHITEFFAQHPKGILLIDYGPHTYETLDYATFLECIGSLTKRYPNALIANLVIPMLFGSAVADRLKVSNVARDSMQARLNPANPENEGSITTALLAGFTGANTENTRGLERKVRADFMSKNGAPKVMCDVQREARSEPHYNPDEQVMGLMHVTAPYNSKLPQVHRGYSDTLAQGKWLPAFAQRWVPGLPATTVPWTAALSVTERHPSTQLPMTMFAGPVTIVDRRFEKAKLNAELAALLHLENPPQFLHQLTSAQAKTICDTAGAAATLSLEQQYTLHLLNRLTSKEDPNDSTLNEIFNQLSTDEKAALENSKCDWVGKLIAVQANIASYSEDNFIQPQLRDAEQIVPLLLRDTQNFNQWLQTGTEPETRGQDPLGRVIEGHAENSQQDSQKYRAQLQALDVALKAQEAVCIHQHELLFSAMKTYAGRERAGMVKHPSPLYHTTLEELHSMLLGRHTSERIQAYAKKKGLIPAGQGTADRAVAEAITAYIKAVKARELVAMEVNRTTRGAERAYIRTHITGFNHPEHPFPHIATLPSEERYFINQRIPVEDYHLTANGEQPPLLDRLLRFRASGLYAAGSDFISKKLWAAPDPLSAEITPAQRTTIKLYESPTGLTQISNQAELSKIQLAEVEQLIAENAAINTLEDSRILAAITLPEATLAPLVLPYVNAALTAAGLPPFASHAFFARELIREAYIAYQSGVRPSVKHLALAAGTLGYGSTGIQAAVGLPLAKQYPKLLLAPVVGYAVGGFAGAAITPFVAMILEKVESLSVQVPADNDEPFLIGYSEIYLSK